MVHGVVFMEGAGVGFFRSANLKKQMVEWGEEEMLLVGVFLM